MDGVSAVVPNYNHARLLPDAIGSLLAQTRPYNEIIVVDDGSTDDSVAVIGALAARHPRLRLIRHGENRGAIAAMNTGLHAASGAFIHFAAADDRFHPELVAETLALLQAHTGAALACGEAVLTERASGTPQGLRPAVRPRAGFCPPAGTRALLERCDNFIVTPTALYRRALLLAHGGFDQALGAFADGFMARRLALSHGFCFTPRVLAEWRLDDAGCSRSQARDVEAALDLLSRALPAFAADPCFPAWYGPLFVRRWRFGVARLAVEAKPTDWAMLRAMLPRAAWPVLAVARRLPRAAQRLALLTALTLLYRPTTLLGLARTQLARRCTPA